MRRPESSRKIKMNCQKARGQFLQLTGALREGWGWVINDHTMQIRGERERLLGRMQVRNCALRNERFLRSLDHESIAPR
jgi:uncharacterized protein YjbJ (UPF0337 family)